MTLPNAGGKKLLLIFAADRQDESDTAEAACRKYGLTYELANSFDSSRMDYTNIYTIIAGTNIMGYWSGEKVKDEAFRPIDQFIRRGGHLVVFGMWNGDHMEQLAKYGIKTGYMHSWFYEEVPGNTSLFFKGNEQLVPDDHRLRCTSNLTCSNKCSVLLKRAMGPGGSGPGNLPGDPAVLTMHVDRGRLTVTSVEPYWSEPPQTRQSLWLITTMISWISRGCPTVEDGGKETLPQPDQSISQSTPVGAGASQTDSNTKSPPTTTTVSKSDIDAYRAAQLSEIDGQIKSVQSLLANLPDAARQSSSLNGRMKDLEAKKQQLSAESDSEIAASITSDREEFDAAHQADSASTTQPVAQNAELLHSALSDEQVDQVRASLIDHLTDEIANAQTKIKQMPFGSAQRQQFADHIRDLRKQLDEIKTASRDSMRQLIAQAEQEKQQEAAAAKVAQEEAAQQVATARQAKFPNWNGPWKTCPVCGGTGEDAIAERKANDQSVSIALQQAEGTTGTRVVGHTAYIPCPTCGGTGQVPDYGN